MGILNHGSKASKVRLDSLQKAVVPHPKKRRASPRVVLTARPFLAHSDHSGPVTLEGELGKTVSPPSSTVVLQTTIHHHQQGLTAGLQDTACHIYHDA